MKVIVKNLYTDKVREFTGTEEELVEQLVTYYPFAVRKGTDLQTVLGEINRSQGYDARLEQ